MFLKSREDFWVATISKTLTFEAPKIFSEFFSPSFGWVLPVAWPRAAAPEAKHRCTWQPAKAAIPWSSGSWRRRQPWMHRTKRAVASEEDIGGEISWGLGIPLRGSGWKGWRFTDGSTFWIFLVDIVLFVWKACPNICTNVWCCCLWTQLYCSYTLGRSFLDSRILV